MLGVAIATIVLAGCATAGTASNETGGPTRGFYVLDIVAEGDTARSPTPDRGILIERYGDWLSVEFYVLYQNTGSWVPVDGAAFVLEVIDGRATLPTGDRILLVGESTVSIELGGGAGQRTYGRRE